jgi:translation initiation factor 4E
MAEQVDLKSIPISPDGGNTGEVAAVDSDKPITVFHDKDNFNVKHPLASRWTLWFTKPSSGKVRLSLPTGSHAMPMLISYQGDNWNDLLKEVITFESVEEFWGIYV